MRYLGSWTLPSGNSADLYVSDEQVELRWDTPPAPGWPREDIEHYQAVTFPEIVQAIATHTGQRVLGVML